MQVGTRTAETLQGQGEQLGRVLDTLDEIHFSMKKAGQVIRDITRGVATDRHAFLPLVCPSESCNMMPPLQQRHMHKHSLQALRAARRTVMGTYCLGCTCPAGAYRLC